jgi:LPXTG-motif cell wall-anchored protein
MRKLTIMGAAVLLTGVSGIAVGNVEAGSRQQAETIITVPLDTVVRGPAGSIHLVDEQSTPAGLVGSTCPGTVTVTNQRSEHPNSDLIIASGATVVTVPDVEALAFASRVTNFTLTLGATIAVQVRLGPDEVFSGGLAVVIDCTAPPTTTVAPTTMAPTTMAPTTMAPTTTVAPTTSALATTSPAPTVAPTTAASTSTTAAGVLPVVTPPPSASTTTMAPGVLPGVGTLPATGSTATPTLLFGLVLVMLGAFLTLRARRS